MTQPMTHGSKTYLVTGGAGFIGSNLVDGLIARGHRVRVLDNFVSGRGENLGAAHSAAEGRLEVIEGDIRDAEAVAAAACEVDGIFHLAALARVPYSLDHPQEVLEVNVLGTLNVLRAAQAAARPAEGGAAAGVPVVYSASSSAYGCALTPEKGWNEYTTTPQPLSPYAVSKLSGEQLCAAYAHCFGLPAMALRYFNVYGPRQLQDRSVYGLVVQKFLHALRTGEAATIYGDGSQTRDFVFVGDVVRANLAAMDRLRNAEGAGGPQGPGGGFTVCNVGTGTSVSVNDLLRACAEALAAEGSTYAWVPPRHEAPRAGDALYTQADVRKVTEVLGWSAAYDLSTGLRETVRWMAQGTAQRSADPAAMDPVDASGCAT